MTPRTRAILVNSPSNPLGTVLPANSTQTLLAFARSRGLWFIADEVYDELSFDDAFVSVGSVADRVTGWCRSTPSPRSTP